MSVPENGRFHPLKVYAEVDTWDRIKIFSRYAGSYFYENVFQELADSPSNNVLLSIIAF